MEAPRQLVFVYGTLRRGGSNHWRMRNAMWIGSGSVEAVLFRIDWYPGLILAEDSGDRVIGEIYQVDAATLAELDVFEGLSAGEIEGSEYRRVKTRAMTPGGCIEAWVWEWKGPVDGSRRIKGGDWLEACPPEGGDESNQSPPG